MKLNKISLLIVLSLIGLGATQAKDDSFNFKDQTVYEIDKVVSLCDGYIEVHLNKNGTMLDQNNKIRYPKESSFKQEGNIKQFNQMYCPMIKNIPLEKIKKQNYYVDGYFFKH
jgi:hypothetical protein